MKSKKRRIFNGIYIGLAVLLVLYLGISAYGSKEAMDIPRLPLAVQASVLGVPCEDVSFSSRVDNLTLKGWFVPGENDTVIIVVHGGYQNRIDANADTPGLTRALAGRGYNILLFDLRGRGESEGRGISLSHIDADIGGAVDYLESRGYAIEDICIMGFSTGAVMACIYGSRNPVGSLILDGCFIDCGTMVVRQAVYLKLPGWVAHFLMPGGIIFTRVLYGYHRIDAIDVMPLVKCPVLFIQEENDAFTRMTETQRLLAVAPNPANEIWEASGATHSQGFILHPQEYTDAVDNFLKKL